MEISNIMELPRDKIIFIIGSIGFLKKVFSLFFLLSLVIEVFVKSILRVQPNVKKYLLIVKAKNVWGAKQHVLTKDYSINKELLKEIGIFVNIAACTNSYERYVVYLSINDLEVKNEMEFVKKCTKIKMLLHVSTVFIEKVLRIQPNVKKLHLLIRAKDGEDAERRMLTEVIGKELFDVLREKHEDGFDAFISEKINPIAGDIVREDLGIEDCDLREKFYKEIDIFVNTAATTNFYERYDVALGINTLGAKNVMKFVKKCIKVEMLLHVSTAYVAGEQIGIIPEKAFQLGEALVEGEQLNVNEEITLVEDRKKELKKNKSTKEVERLAMKELGIERAKMFGWPNTYVFTKAMGEMLLGHLRGDLSLVIVRPTIITSICKDLFPGWIEGIRTIDSIILGYLEGKISYFPGDPDANYDLIPGDMVVNAMIVAMATNSNKKTQSIYHVSSSLTKNVNCTKLAQCAYNYTLKNPCMTKQGKEIKTRVRFLKSMSCFDILMLLHYYLTLMGLFLSNLALCRLNSPSVNKLRKEYNLLMQFVYFHRPYIFFKGIFETTNLDKLRMAMINCGESTLLDFDPKNIDWDDYLVNIHIPGVLKHNLPK
ncbi:hypothetical protein HPP92_006542 [Vanilla planifolia]|uniref:Fatty acyl-CoA reductase n=1 Tax=Vanilla planifolia TaxID=51239 RepID=A0A835REK6_VANPL|nr:hypothetical protein HPP92_006542 [Vanilla planifolia]